MEKKIRLFPKMMSIGTGTVTNNTPRTRLRREMTKKKKGKTIGTKHWTVNSTAR